MKPVYRFALAVLVLTLILSGCAPATAPAPLATATSEPIAVTDATGTSVQLAAPAQKIVSLAPSNTEILFALGAGAQVIARDDFSNFPAEAANLPTVGGNMGSYNLEEITRLQPDLILASPLNAPELIESFRAITPNVFVVANPTEMSGLYQNLENVGELTGRSNEAKQLVSSMTARVQAVQEKVAGVSAKPKVFYELDATDPAKPWTAGPGTFIDLLIGMAGGQNIGASLQGEWAQISQEELIVQNPDVILLGDALYGGITAESVAARPGWGSIQAVASGRVLPFNDDLVSRPGPRMVDGLEELAKAIHPDLFK